MTEQAQAVVSVKCRRCKAHVGLHLPGAEGPSLTLAQLMRAVRGKDG